MDPLRGVVSMLTIRGKGGMRSRGNVKIDGMASCPLDLAPDSLICVKTRFRVPERSKIHSLG